VAELEVRVSKNAKFFITEIKRKGRNTDTCLRPSYDFDKPKAFKTEPGYSPIIYTSPYW